VGAATLYLAAAFTLFARAWRHPGTATVGHQDSLLFSWWLRWVPYAVAHGHNPFVTHALNYPAGANTMWNTSVVLPALLLAPLTVTAGPTTSLLLLQTLAPATSALALCLCLRGLGSRWSGALLAGLVYGFGPFMIGASYGHVQMTLAWFPPLVLYVVVKQLRHPARAVRRGVALGIAIAAQLLSGEELLADTALVAALVSGLAALTFRAQARSAIRPMAAMLGSAALVALVLDGWPLAVQLWGPQRPNGTLAGHGAADLASWVIPTPLLELSSPGANHVSRHFIPNLSEAGGYIGIPVLMVLVVLARRSWSDPRMRLAVTSLVAIEVVSLGSPLHVLDAHRTPLLLPWAAVERLPVLSDVLTVRLALFAALAVAVIVALGISDLAHLPRRQRRSAIVLTALAFLSWLPVPVRATTPATPPFFERAADLRLIPAGSHALVLPYPAAHRADAMLWQARADMRFIIFGGYFVGPGSHRISYQGQPSAFERHLIQLSDPTGRDTFARVPTGHVRNQLRALAPDEILIGPMDNADVATKLFTQALGAPPLVIGGVAMWTSSELAPLLETP
jgi:hypothetical protein